jgi:hypothetical protein
MHAVRGAAGSARSLTPSLSARWVPDVDKLGCKIRNSSETRFESLLGAGGKHRAVSLGGAWLRLANRRSDVGIIER